MADTCIVSFIKKKGKKENDTCNVFSCNEYAFDCGELSSLQRSILLIDVHGICSFVHFSSLQVIILSQRSQELLSQMRQANLH